MKLIVFAMAAAAILPCAEPSLAQDIGDSPVAWTAGQVGEMVQGIGRLRGQRAAFERQIQIAREAYFTAQATGQRLVEAGTEFAALLLEKDFFYLSMYVPEGPNSDHAEGLIRVAMGGHVDGGIPAAARREYDAWVQKIRRALGARSPDQLIFVLDQQRAIDAIIGAQEEYRTYKRARDRAELSARGLAVAGAESTSQAPVSRQVSEVAQRRDSVAH